MPRHRQDVAFACALFAIALIARVAYGAGNLSMYWPDEIHQSVEQAHRVVFGFGYVPWEYEEGARSWVFPGLLAAVLWSSDLVGLGDPGAYTEVLRVLLALCGALAVVATYALARVCGAAALSAAAGAAIVALAAPVVYFAHRPLTETATMLPVVAGFALVLGGARADRRGLVAGGASLLGLAVGMRLHTALLCAGLLVLLAAARRWRALRLAGLTFAGWAAALAVLDWATWGSPLWSARQYVRFNVVEDISRRWGTEPFGWYAAQLADGAPLLAAAVGVGLLAALFGRARGLALVAVGALLVYEATPHKELRFVLPVLPLLCAAAAAGLSELGMRLPRARWAPAAAVALGAALSLATLPDLRRDDLGSPDGPEVAADAWFADENRLLVEAGRRDDLCGLLFEAGHTAWSGGYTLLHRRVPLYRSDLAPPAGARHFNYVLTARPWPGEVVARRGALQLVRIGRGCVPDPSFDFRL